MPSKQIILSVLTVLHAQWLAQADFTSVNYFSKDLNLSVAAKATDELSVIVSTPESDVYWKYFYFNYIKCEQSSNECEVGQDCFNCPKAYEATKCRFSLPYNDSLPLGKVVALKTQADRVEQIIIDWASKARFNDSSDQSKKHRKIQVVSMANCSIGEVAIELSGSAAGMRKIVLDRLSTSKRLDMFYIDYRMCSESGWVRRRLSSESNKAQVECLSGLAKSKQKFLMDAVTAADSSQILLDKGKSSWALYQLKDGSSEALSIYEAKNLSDDLFEIPRLSMHNDNFGSVCWLADIEASYSLNCTIFRAEPRYIRELSLDFHYKVRDFELKMVDFKRLYVLTSSSDETSCVYDLWLFDIKGRLIDGPLRVQGPRCVFSHRLDPRPVITQLNRDKVCLSFAFERPAREPGFRLMTECLLHSQSRAKDE